MTAETARGVWVPGLLESLDRGGEKECERGPGRPGADPVEDEVAPASRIGQS
jgi:hypothetical protein